MHVGDHLLAVAEQGQQLVDQHPVGGLVAGPDVVHLARRPLGQDQVHRRAVVVHVQPVALVAAVAVERDGPAVEQVGGEQRDRLLGVLVGPEVVGAASDGDRRAVGGEVGQGDQVGSGLGRRVGRARLERIGLGGRTDLDRAVHLVGADVDHPADLQAPGRVHDHVGAEAVGVHEVVGADDGAVDVALGREVDHRVVAGHGLVQRATVGDVALDEPVPRAVVDVAQGGEVSGVGQRVVHGDLVVGVGQDPAHVVGSDEPGSAGDELLHAGRSGVRAAGRSAAATAARSRSAAGSAGRGPTGSGRSGPSRPARRDRSTPPPARRWGCSSRRPGR